MAKKKSTKAPKKVAKKSGKKSRKSSKKKLKKILVLSVANRNEARRELTRYFKQEGLNIQERNALRKAQANQFKGKE